MPTVNPTTPFTQFGDTDNSNLLITWTLLTASPDGLPVEFYQWADVCWQGTGTWGGATLSFEGSNDNTNWFPLSNAAGGAAATLTANGGKATIERARYLRPNLSVVGVGATVVVTLVLRRQQPLRS